jgi:hypothetical protein
MMAMKNVHQDLYQNDYLYSKPENYKYYNPNFVKILELFYRITEDITISIQILNAIMVFMYIIIFTFLLNKVFGKYYLSLLMVVVSAATIVTVTEGELWGYFIAYNSSARGVYGILLLIVLALFVYLKDRKYFSYYMVMLFSVLGLISSIHPPTGLSAGVCCGVFIFSYRSINLDFAKYKWIIISIISFCIFFVLSSVIPYSGNVNPFASRGIILQNYYFISDFTNSLSSNILKVYLLSFFKIVSPQSLISIYLVSSVLLFVLLHYNKLNRSKYFIISGIFNLPFIFYAICLPIIQTMLNFPIKPHLFSFVGFVPVLVYLCFLSINYKNLNLTSFVVQLLLTSLILSTFGLSLFLTYYVNYINKEMVLYVASSIRGMRFFYIILPFMLINIIITMKKLYLKVIFTMLPILLIYQVFMQDKVYSEIPDSLLKVIAKDKSEEFLIKWENDAIKRPFAIEESANWLKYYTDKNSLILFFPKDYYMESSKLKCLSERSFVVDQSSITQYSKNKERSDDFKNLISGNYNFEEYINKYRPDYIVKDKQFTYSQNMNYAVVFENEIYKIYKVKENQ